MTVRAPADAVEFLHDSLKIYSPTSHEAEYAGFLADKLRSVGYSGVRIDKAGNVVGEAGKGRQSLLLCGHMDTVPGALPVMRTRMRLSGRGASDAKAPLCVLLLGGAAAADQGVRITFAGVTEEEGDGRGIEELIRSRRGCDFAVFGEPSGANKITVGYRGRASVYLKVRTQGGHASSNWAHHSAFDEFQTLLHRIRDYEASKSVEGDHFRSLSVTPTIVSAGSFHNVVPSTCDATLDLRVPPGTTVATAVSGIRSALQSHGKGSTVNVTQGEATEAYEADPGSTLVRAFQRAILLSLREKPALVRKTGTGDMNTYAHKTGTICLTYGPGDPRASHTETESVAVRDYLDSLSVVEEAIKQLAQLGHDATA